MELFLGSIAVTAICTVLCGIDGHIHWIDSYEKLAEESRQNQLDESHE